jgi:hypothetical protein
VPHTTLAFLFFAFTVLVVELLRGMEGMSCAFVCNTGANSMAAINPMIAIIFFEVSFIVVDVI